MSQLPPLRADLILDPDPTYESGDCFYLLHDPLKNNYFRLDELTMSILRYWYLLDSDQVIQALEAEDNLFVPADKIKKISEFLAKHELIESCTDGYLETLINRAGKKKFAFHQLVQHYLFYKIDLCRSDNFIKKTLPLVQFIFTPTYWLLMLAVFIFSAIALLAQRTYFFSLIENFNTLPGLSMVIVGMLLLKITHELGHAYAARRSGCEVGGFGVMFILLFPILFTDVKSSWKLKSAHQRLLIDVSGILFESQFIIWCMLLWQISDSYFIKQGLSYVIIIGLMSTLLINTNPLIKFDGYHALSNFLKTDNLQQKSFDLATGWLRHKLLGIDLHFPHAITSIQKKFFIGFAITTWIYRLFLYLGIAFVVYQFAFKLLGIILFLVEVVFLIAKPILSELKFYGSTIMKNPISRQYWRFYLLLFFLLFIAFYPWSSTLTIPATLTYANKHNIYATESGELSYLVNSDLVDKSRPVVKLRSENLLYMQEMAQEKLNFIKLKILNEKKNSYSSYDESELFDYEQVKNQQENITRHLNKLQINAPISGQIANKDPLLAITQNISKDTFLFSILNLAEYQVMAYIPEYELNRIEYMREPVFLSDNANQPAIPLSFKSKSVYAQQTLSTPYLASTYEGVISVYPTTHPTQEVKLKDSYFQMNFTVPNGVKLPFEQRGWVVMKVKRQSLASRAYVKLAGLLIKESAF